MLDTLASYVKTKREKSEMSVRKLAEKAEISHTEIKRIEDGTRKQPSPKILKTIAAALNVPYNDIMIAAGYLNEAESGDLPTMMTASQSKSSALDIAELTERELEDVKRYITFIKSQR
ncbi:helix-turn-helix domain-containing protein [Dehalobacter sp. TBBPA1]|uniref:helix-turn-helix domain-containing protein n=1 Tax=Dehalobacter sp. TBBPA1 TaxID=3235037 RepID=UPI0034A3647C